MQEAGEPSSTQEQPYASRVLELEDEVLRLQHKLGELHTGDYNALRRAYDSLCQHVSALEDEARGMVGQLHDFETAAVPPELVAKELGVAGMVAFGVALLHTTLKALPFKSPVLSKGLVLVGGAFVLARLTGGALAHVAGMFSRNAARKRRLLRKLQGVEERIQIMASLQQWAEQQAAAAAAAAAEGTPAEGAPAEGAAPPPPEVPPPRVSPATSSGSSAELVEMPRVEEEEELEAAEAGERPGQAGQASAAGASAAAPARSSSGGGGNGGGRAGSSSSSSLNVLLAYAELGQKRQ
ncbi:hypothetical protein ABPG75_004075 [Micractinium tetrahymenae]